jgi:hypothetical protein
MMMEGILRDGGTARSSTHHANEQPAARPGDDRVPKP